MDSGPWKMALSCIRNLPYPPALIHVSTGSKTSSTQGFCQGVAGGEGALANSTGVPEALLLSPWQTSVEDPRTLFRSCDKAAGSTKQAFSNNCSSLMFEMKPMCSWGPGRILALPWWVWGKGLPSLM